MALLLAPGCKDDPSAVSDEAVQAALDPVLAALGHPAAKAAPAKGGKIGGKATPAKAGRNAKGEAAAGKKPPAKPIAGATKDDASAAQPAGRTASAKGEPGKRDGGPEGLKAHAPALTAASRAALADATKAEVLAMDGAPKIASRIVPPPAAAGTPGEPAAAKADAAASAPRTPPGRAAVQAHQLAAAEPGLGREEPSRGAGADVAPGAEGRGPADGPERVPAPARPAPAAPGSDPRLAGVTAVAPAGRPLDVDRYLSLADVLAVLGNRQVLRRGELQGIAPSTRYGGAQFEPARGKDFGVAVQVWLHDTMRDAHTRFRQMVTSYPNAVESDNVTPKTFFGYWEDVYYLAFLDQRSKTVLTISCGRATCTPQQLFNLAVRARDRLQKEAPATP